MSLARHLRSLGARFDAQALRPPVAAAGAGMLLQRHGKLHDQLQAWCWQGAGPGKAAWWQPAAQPALGQRLAVAALQGPDAARLTDWANAFARQLDGSVALAALPGRWAGLQLRLGVKLHDAAWWRARRQDDPWDAGWAAPAAAATEQLQHHFLPRRATLILADAQAVHTLQPGLAALALRSADFSHPVRWLWVGGAADLAAPPGLALARFAQA